MVLFLPNWKSQTSDLELNEGDSSKIMVSASNKRKLLGLVVTIILFLVVYEWVSGPRDNDNTPDESKFKDPVKAMITDKVVYGMNFQ